MTDSIKKLLRLNLELEGALRVLLERNTDETLALVRDKYDEFRACFDVTVPCAQTDTCEDAEDAPVAVIDDVTSEHLDLHAVDTNEPEEDIIVEDDDIDDLPTEEAESTEDEPAEDEPVAEEETAVEEPVAAEEPFVEEPFVEEPAAEDVPLAGEPEEEEPVVEEAIEDEPIAEETATGIDENINPVHETETVLMLAEDADDDGETIDAPVDETLDELVDDAVDAPLPEAFEEPQPEPSVFTVSDVLARKNAKQLSKAFTINDRFRFIRGIFGDDKNDFDYTIDQLSALSSLDEAYDYLLNELGWDIDNDEVKEFISIVANHFNS